VSVPASRISLTRRSCKVPKEPSTRPLAGAELAHTLEVMRVLDRARLSAGRCFA
jgi:hypothetical protein